MSTHYYRGDRWTAEELRGVFCTLPKRKDGKCIRGRNGNILVQLEDGRRVVVAGRQLRKIPRLF